MRVMKAWRLTPEGWRAQSADDRAMMIAFEKFEAVRESYRQQWQEQVRERAARKEQGRGARTDEFEAMKQRMRI